MIQESWIRRGHTRKPNAIVRGIYAVGDWLGDFSPLVSATGRAGGAFALVVTNLVILIGIIIMSAAHSLDLLRAAGLKNGLEYVGVIVWELVFIFSSILLAQQFKVGKGSRPSWAWAGFVMGFLFVETSNITATLGSVFGIIFGAATPVLLLVCKGLLGHAFKAKPVNQVEIQPPLEQGNHNENAYEDIGFSLVKNHEKSSSKIEQNNLKSFMKETADGDKIGDSENAEIQQHNSENGTSDRAKNQEKKVMKNPETASSKKLNREQTDGAKTNQKIMKNSAPKSGKNQAWNEEKITDAELLRHAKKLRSKTGEIPKLQALMGKANSKYQAEKIRKQLVAEVKQEEVKPKLQLVKND